MSIERSFNGGWNCSALVSNRLVQKHYMGYAKREAANEFRLFIKNLKD